MTIKIPGGSDRLISVKITPENPNITKSKNGKELILLEPVTLEVFTTDGEYRQVIRQGYRWDGASIPQKFWVVVGKPTDAEFHVPSLIHDFLYGQRHNRQIADDVFYHLLDKEPKVSGWKVRAMFWAVRVGGFVYYASDTSKFWTWVRKAL